MEKIDKLIQTIKYCYLTKIPDLKSKIKDILICATVGSAILLNSACATNYVSTKDKKDFCVKYCTDNDDRKKKLDGKEKHSVEKEIITKYKGDECIIQLKSDGQYILNDEKCLDIIKSKKESAKLNDKKNTEKDNTKNIVENNKEDNKNIIDDINTIKKIMTLQQDQLIRINENIKKQIKELNDKIKYYNKIKNAIGKSDYYDKKLTEDYIRKFKFELNELKNKEKEINSRIKVIIHFFKMDNPDIYLGNQYIKTNTYIIDKYKNLLS